MDATELRAVLPGTSLWRALGLSGYDQVVALDGGKKEVKICSPFRADSSPSFSVTLSSNDGSIICTDWSEDRTWNDWALIAYVQGVDEGDSVSVLKAWHDLAGVDWGKVGKASAKVKPKPKSVEIKMPLVQQTAQGDRPSKVKEVTSAQSSSVLVASYDYCDENGVLLHQTLRYDPKKFMQRRRAKDHETSSDGWIWSLKGGRLVPYRLPEIVDNPHAMILIVEGEKDADVVAGLLADRNIVVTTLPMGCGKWRDEYASHFVGRRVCVLADFDEPREDGKAAGFDGALKVGKVLRDVCQRVGLLELTGFWASAPYGSDVSDWVELGRDSGVCDREMADRLERCIRDARLPRGVVYEGCVAGGPSSLKVDEDILARRLVNDEELIFTAASFWRYDGLGLWEREPDPFRVESVIRDAMRACGGGGLITKSRISSIYGLAKSVRHCSADRMNRQPGGMVNVKNGLLDTKTGQLLPHRADYYMQTRVPHKWEPKALCKVWLDWLEERHPDKETRTAIQEMFGYVLATDINFHVFFFLFGDGGTGKSTCVSVLEELVGEANRVSIQLEELDNAFMRSQLAGKSLYLCKELTTKSFAHIGLIKAIVSGDPIPVDVKYSQPYDFKPFGKMVMESNVIASTPDSSGGFTRRFVQIDWDRPIAREKMDFNLIDKFRDEMPGILAWAMEGLIRLRKRGHFPLTAKAEQSRDQLMRHRSQIASFLSSSYLVEEESCHMPVRILYDKYYDWCDEYDVVPFYKEVNTFMREVMSKKPEWRARKKRIRVDDGRQWVIAGLGSGEKGV
jgi:P4 family phage/plasmid primase-like protien